jgi:hypothetical protein
VTPQTKVRLLKTIFNDAKMVCVLSSGRPSSGGDGNKSEQDYRSPRDSLLGVITKIDLIDYLATRRS